MADGYKQKAKHCPFLENYRAVALLKSGMIMYDKVIILTFINSKREPVKVKL